MFLNVAYCSFYLLYFVDRCTQTKVAVSTVSNEGVFEGLYVKDTLILKILLNLNERLKFPLLPFIFRY